MAAASLNAGGFLPIKSPSIVICCTVSVLRPAVPPMLDAPGLDGRKPIVTSVKSLPTVGEGGELG